MPPRHLLVFAVLLMLSGCAAFRTEPPIERDAGYRLDLGLAALDAGRYREAFDDLAWVYTHCPDHARGAEALVGLAALELDPRNNAARPGVASDLLGRVIREPASPAFVRPLAESAYLMARTLGAPAAPAWVAPEPPEATASPAPAAADSAVPGTADSSGVRVTRAADLLGPPAAEPTHGCGARISREGWIAPRLPDVPGPSLVSLLATAEQARDASTAEAARLRGELEAARQRLAETEAELERIRQTLKP
ncbi:MAG: hypothetical protein KY466_04965 [Gemmatimonadetes bacterium]|nr:hypothetical protein [Gemmatimonadota bacterium]